MRLVVDGIFFQLNSTGIARVWQTILAILAKKDNLEVFLLDRGGSPEIEGINNIPFPSYKAGDVAADSVLIQKVCEHLHADVFTSTYYTTPLSVPMALMVYDMIPELFDFDLSLRAWMEKETAIAYAQKYLAISYSTRQDLLRFYPEIPEDHIQVAHCGIDRDAFTPRSALEVAEFRNSHELRRPYFLFVGSRVQHNAYKNSGLFFEALELLKEVDFDVLCVGGETEIEAEVISNLPEGVGIKRVALTDYELSLAYGGAIALVYPSLYEGFGMPVIEAMASGCPVITTHNGSLVEAAGEAAWLISGRSKEEMAEALAQLKNPAVQNSLREKGLSHVKKFQWAPMADLLEKQLYAVAADASRKETQAFFSKWTRLRKLQADVDII